MGQIPTWFYCTVCGFGGDILDYFSTYHRIPPEKQEAVFKSRFSWYQPEDKYFKRYMLRKKVRLHCEKLWKSLQVEAVKINHKKKGRIPHPSCVRVTSSKWVNILNRFEWPSEFISDESIRGGYVKEHVLYRANRKNIKTQVIMRASNRPGELSGFIFIDMDDTQSWMLRPITRFQYGGIGMLDQLFEEKSPGQIATQVISFNPIRSYYLSSKFLQEFGYLPAVGAFPMRAAHNRAMIKKNTFTSTLKRMDLPILWEPNDPLALSFARKYRVAYSDYDPEFAIDPRVIPSANRLMRSIENNWLLV